ncbi:MAG: hypothetical protein DPW09_14160 [Anaerolineae bacterium]|nr:hypothetical protein [Anaerolineales bacterium]MCQ3974581.1 hypothetical protein [Anaerolineae bacterium]
MDDVNKNPKDETEGNEIESPVDGPTPDWMRLATSAGSSGSSLTEENTPAWLKSIRAGQGVTQEKKPAEPPSPPPAQPAAQAEEGLSDLERLLAEEGIDLGSVAEERPEGSSGMSARDWLISTSSEEIIRNKLGAQPPAEEPPAPPSPSPAPAPASDEGMSDWERLLAEEGIDLGAVDEERPEGSGGMSARDWLIATSSEEIIRNKLGAQPPAEEAPAPLPSTSFSDDKMVVESDLPDWLQEIADDVAEAEASEMNWPVSEPEPPVPSPVAAKEDDMLVVEEELPDWLQEMADDSSVAPTPEEAFTPPSTSALVPEEDKMVVEEDLPDWLRDIADDEARPPVEEIEPVKADFEAPAPLPEAAPPSFTADKMVVEEDLPDWLQDLAEEETASELPPAAEPSVVSATTDQMVVEGELPDWLQEIAEESDLAVEPPLPPEPDFIAAPPSPPSLAEDKMIVADDLPDWLREAAEEVEPGPEPEASAPVPAALDADKMVVDEDLPDWLREVETGDAEDVVLTQAGFEAVPPELDELESDEDLPDWLREVEVSNLEDNLVLPPRPIVDSVAEESTFAATPLSDEELEAFDEEDLPSWLKEVQEQNGRETSEAIGQPLVTEFNLSPESTGEGVGDELPGWLRDVQEETTPLEFEALEPLSETAEDDEQMVIEEGLPDWLREEEFNLDEPFEPSEPSPEPLPEVVADELPDWLQEIQDEAPEEALSFEETPEPVTATISSSPLADGIIDEEGLPDWLREEEAEEEAEAVEPIEIVEEVIEPEAPEPISEPEPEPLPEPVSEPIEAAPTGIPDWLQKLREVDEEQPVSVPIVSMPPPVQVAAPRLAAQPVYAQTVVSTPDIPADAAEQLQLARTTRDKGNLDEAVRIYDALVSRGIYLDKIIEDMQQSIKAHPTNYLLFQLMGDAMMRDGRLQSALNAYREALSRL